jgi:UDP-N-acetylglucosamine--N-acetylmuramyl-(pentapeptide) pyrophosphoryl-undecaprenol N-acetylglucosamine transferase
LDIRHQTGPAHSEVVTAAYQKETLSRVEVLPYIEDMASAYAWADLVLCRAGALTVAELTIMSRPSILVPLPQAIDNHQVFNAEWLTQQSACLLMPQSELSPQLLADTLTELAAQPARLAAMASAAAAAARPQATRVVADICEEVRREP